MNRYDVKKEVKFNFELHHLNVYAQTYVKFGFEFTSKY